MPQSGSIFARKRAIDIRAEARVKIRKINTQGVYKKMKLKRLFTAILATMLLLSAFALTACGGDGDNSTSGGGNSGNKAQTYTMEAEYTDLDNVIGTGISSDQSGVNMIYGDATDAQKKMWSNGYFVGYTYTSKCKLTFKFTADEAADATFILALGSEIGNIALSPENFRVELNGAEVNYSGMTVPNSSDIAQMAFKDFTVATGLKLKKGENTVTLSVLPNKLMQGSKDGGPCIDCLKIKTSAKLTWTDKTDNPSQRGSM